MKNRADEEDNGGGEDYATWRQQGRQWGGGEDYATWRQQGRHKAGSTADPAMDAT